MKKSYVGVFLLLLLFNSCKMDQKENQMEKWRNEIREVEQQFARMAHDEGVPKAFIAFAAEEAVLLRNDKLVAGKAAIKAYFESKDADYKNIQLSWKPDHIEVSSSGDLGYTYGRYTYTHADAAGVVTNAEGIFHTVWKRQPDGSWLYVWD